MIGDLGVRAQPAVAGHRVVVHAGDRDRRHGHAAVSQQIHPGEAAHPAAERQVVALADLHARSAQILQVDGRLRQQTFRHDARLAWGRRGLRLRQGRCVQDDRRRLRDAGRYRRVEAYRGEPQCYPAEADLIPGPQLRRIDALAIDVNAVAAARVVDNGGVVEDPNAGVPPRDLRVVEDDVTARIAPQDVVAGSKFASAAPGLRRAPVNLESCPTVHGLSSRVLAGRAYHDRTPTAS